MLKLIKTGERITVLKLVERATRLLGLKDYEAARAIWKLREEGFLDIIDPNPPKSFLGFMFSSRSAWFWILLSVVTLTLTSIYMTPQTPPLVYLRYVVGATFTLYLPGAALIELLYPKRGDLSQLERLALSIGLSLALVPLVGLILNYTPWKIKLTPVLLSLTILTVSLSVGAVARKYSYHRLAYGAGR